MPDRLVYSTVRDRKHRGGKTVTVMKAWCEEQLVTSPVYRPSQRPTNGINDAGLFLFGAIPPGGLCSTDVFLSPLWYAPFDNQAQALIQI